MFPLISVSSYTNTVPYSTRRQKMLFLILSNEPSFCLICITLMHQSFAFMMICSDEFPESQLKSEMGMGGKGNQEPH